jgi:hypothetical protein
MKIRKLLLKHVLRNHIYCSIWRLCAFNNWSKEKMQNNIHGYFTTSWWGLCKYNVNEDDMVCIPHDMSIALESLDNLTIFKIFRTVSCQNWLHYWQVNMDSKTCSLQQYKFPYYGLMSKWWLELFKCKFCWWTWTWTLRFGIIFEYFSTCKYTITWNSTQVQLSYHVIGYYVVWMTFKVKQTTHVWRK